METTLNPISIPGWTDLKAAEPVRAFVLQALTNLELAFHRGDSAARPTNAEITAEAIHLGARIIGSNVTHEVLLHLEELVVAGHVLKLGGKSPWRSRYLVLPPPSAGGLREPASGVTAKALPSSAKPKTKAKSKAKVKKEELNEILDAVPTGSLDQPQPHQEQADGPAGTEAGDAPVEDGPAPEGAVLD